MTNAPSLLISEDELFKWINCAQSSTRKEKRKLAMQWLGDQGVPYRRALKGVICVTAIDLTVSKIIESEKEDMF